MADAQEVVAQLYANGTIKPFAKYLIIGDEPKGAGVINLKEKMTDEQVKKIKSLLQLMPRMILRAWFDINVLAAMPGEPELQFEAHRLVSSVKKKPYEDMIWAGFIDLFNEANLEYINKNNVTPWNWEDQKLQSYYLSQNKEDTDKINQDFNNYKALNDLQDPQAQDLVLEYNSLPKLGDLGLEISRQFAIRELLARKEYKQVKGIIEAYRYAQYTILGDVLTKPIPFDIVSNDGTIVKATPTT